MIIFFAVMLMFAVLGIRKADGQKWDSMSVRTTNSIKGFFLWMVFAHHIWSYADFSNVYFDRPYEFVRKTGQCIVVMFLFYSGYGVMESIKRKGQGYVRRIPVQRFLKVLLQFDGAVLFYLIYRAVTGVHYDIKQILRTLIGWGSVGNSNWYIFCILWIYVFTFLAFLVFRENHGKAVLGVFLCSLLYVAIVCRLRGAAFWWYDTVLCYTLGMVYSLYRRRIEAFINESRGSWLFFLFVFSLGYIGAYFYRNNGPFFYQLWLFCFVAAIITFTMRFAVDSRPLQWMGERLFELYILHRLAMLILQPYILTGNVTSFTNYVYVAACFLTTILFAVIYRMTIGRIVGRIIEKIAQSLYV